VQGRLTMISYLAPLFKVRFTQDSGLFRVRFTQVKLTMISYLAPLFKVQFTQDLNKPESCVNCTVNKGTK
jgi:hypothetical protein